MKPCKNCGTANINSVKKCEECGNNFNDTLMPDSKKESITIEEENKGWFSFSAIEIALHFSPIYIAIPVYFFWGWIPALITFIILFLLFTII